MLFSKPCGSLAVWLFCVFCSIFGRQKNEKNHFLTSVVPLPRLTYRPNLRFPNTLPQARMLPAFCGFKGNDLLLIFKLQSPSGVGQPPEMLSYLAPPWFSAPAADSPLYCPQMPLLRHTLYKLQQRFFLHLICHSTPVRARFIAPNTAALRRQNWISGARKASSTKVSAAGIW